MRVLWGQVPEEGVPGGGHRYVLVFLNGVAIVDAIYVANLPCFDGGLPWLWGVRLGQGECRGGSDAVGWASR